MPTRAKCGSEEKLNLRAGQDYVNLLWYSYHIKAKFLNILLSSRWLCARLLRTAQILQEYRKHLKASAFLSPFPLYSTILYALHISQGSQTWPTAIADNQCVSSERKTLPDFLHFWDIWKGQHFFYFFIWKEKSWCFNTSSSNQTHLWLLRPACILHIQELSQKRTRVGIQHHPL